MTPRTPGEVLAELARVRAALPPPGAPPARIEHVAADAECDVDTCIRRIGQLASAGEAWVKSQNGSLMVRAAVPVPRFVPKELPFSVLPVWQATPEPSAAKKQAKAEAENRGDAWEGKDDGE